ncbi:RagB/SusD family nutrient uptake outer membrane protein [Pedobacter endophyticus]|uniref:RagB/SusD family nutrient uptake outer membrane protein n=1 Tax=Pedobacter endophyticus TaxID=2789740 RepID=A0A7S9Q1A1_9SPHI|nr:RagB/SusD family nutrient uptake outer membrane protein [Pedobacter endophyticus]QPH41557.1 RagB/SusD family nutrient uptake outer membrane protein [Pedobacter endophyticus]
MKKIIIYTIILAATFCLPACKKFLDIQPLDKLTGNNFFQSKEDVVANIYNLSRIVFGKYNETHFIGATGEYRSGEVMYESQSDHAPARSFVEALGRNDLLYLLSGGVPWVTDINYNFNRITDWTGYYQAIQGANILMAKLDEGIPGVTEAEKQSFKAEAAFIRSLSYFIMVRLFGDVVYYTDPFHATAQPRENFVSVLNKCIADLKTYKDAIAWTYSDPSIKGVRASRGSIVALMMEMNMWNAGFDAANADNYYRETAALGKELIASNAFRLVPITDWATVVKGRSDESLFEFYRSINYGDANTNLAPVADMFLHYPYKRPEYTHRVSFAYYRGEYMQKLFQDGSDRRITTWFDENIFADNGKFMMLKFAQNAFATGEEDANPDNTFMIFRYGGEILLAAEAMANIGEDGDAIKLLNMVRDRAQASRYSGGGGSSLKDFIFYERSRELIGEGHHYYDLVRTKRILSNQWSYNVLTADKFNRGAWTWPLNANARNNNPFVVLNDYWVNGGN